MRYLAYAMEAATMYAEAVVEGRMGDAREALQACVALTHAASAGLRHHGWQRKQAVEQAGAMLAAAPTSSSAFAALAAMAAVEGANNEPVARITLTQPVCTQENEKIALSRRVDKHWRLIGWGEIRKGNKIEMNKAFKVEAGAGELSSMDGL